MQRERDELEGVWEKRHRSIASISSVHREKSKWETEVRSAE